MSETVSIPSLRSGNPAGSASSTGLTGLSQRLVQDGVISESDARNALTAQEPAAIPGGRTRPTAQAPTSARVAMTARICAKTIGLVGPACCWEEPKMTPATPATSP